MTRMPRRRRLLSVATAGVATLAALAAGLLTGPAGSASAATTHGAGGSPATHGTAYGWSLVDTPTSTARLRGLDAVSRRIVWASGTEGTVLRTVDGGHTVTSVGPAGTDAIQFRDIEATSARHAVIMGIGDTPDAFRFYVTDDGGRHWTLAYQNTNPNAFYDCMAFTSPRVGYAVSDPVGGRFRILRTTDAGHSWRVMSNRGMPAAEDGEFAFAASGTCLQTDPRGTLFLGSGGVDPARIFRSTDGARTWTVQDSPVAGAAAGGIFSLSFGAARGGVAVGGDYTDPTAATANAAWTSDRGRTWHAASGLGGYRSGSAWLRNGSMTVIAVGPTGSDVSTNGGRTYATFDTGTFDSVECAGGTCYASGDLGRLAVLTRTPGAVG